MTEYHLKHKGNIVTAENNINTEYIHNAIKRYVKIYLWKLPKKEAINHINNAAKKLLNKYPYIIEESHNNLFSLGIYIYTIKSAYMNHTITT